MPPTPLCTGCNRTPDQIDEYREMAVVEKTTPVDFVLENEGTLNPVNHHFLCTDCYIAAGEPSLPHPRTWVAP